MIVLANLRYQGWARGGRRTAVGAGRADGRIRTGDPVLTMHVLYLLSYVGLTLRILPPRAGIARVRWRRGRNVGCLGAI